MYAAERMPGTLAGIESLNVSMYWNAIKDRIADLQQLPTWCTNHAMKLGITVSNLRAKGRHDLVALLDTEIQKVNDDIARAWKVKGYIDSYFPEWMSAASAAAAGPVVASTTMPKATTPTGVVLPPSYQQPTTAEQITGWIGSWFGGGGVQGLGVLPIILSAAALAALAYCVTTGMALYQDYVTKKDLTQAVIEGKMSSGQAADIIVASRPPESLASKMGVQFAQGAGGGLILLAGAALLYYAFVVKSATKMIP